MGSRNKEEVAGQCVGTVTTDHTDVSLEAAIRLFMCWGGSVRYQTVGQ